MIPLPDSTMQQAGFRPSEVDVMASDDSRMALQAFLERNIRNASDPLTSEKIYQYRNARLNELYFRGKQYVQMFMGANQLNYRILGDVLSAAPGGQSDNPFLYDYIFPLFKSAVLKLSSVIGTRAPNLEAAAIIAGDQGQIRRARIAQRFYSYLSNHLNLDAVQPNLVQILSLYGTAFGNVSWQEDATMFGQTAPPPIFASMGESGYQCQSCGAMNSEADVSETGGACKQCGEQITPDSYIPPQGGVPLDNHATSPLAMTPNGAIALRLGSIMTIDIPYYMNGIHEAPSGSMDKVDWLMEEYETSKWGLIAQYKDTNPELLEHISDPLQASPLSKASLIWASNIRQASLSPSGTRGFTTGANELWLHTGLWITPKMYEGISQIDKSGNLAQIMKTRFSDGAKFCYANSRLVAIYGEKLTSSWSTCKPDFSPGIFADPIFDDVRQACDVVNDALNIVIQGMEHSIGELAYDKGILDKKYLTDNRADYGTWLPVVPTTGRALADHFFRIPGADFRQDLWNFVVGYMDKVMEAKGIVPTLFGGGAVEQTARGAEIKRNQALAQHVLTWKNIGAFHQSVAENAAHLAARKSDGTLYLKAKSGTESVTINSLHELQEGGWKYSAEETFPLTPGQRRDFIMDMIGNPAMASMLSVIDPMDGQPIPQNLDKLKEAAQLDDWYITNLDQYNRLMDVIHQLLSQAPIQMPAPDGSLISQPTAPPDMMLFDGPFAMKTVRGWMQSDEGREESEENPPGYANVQAYLQAWQMAMAPPPMPMGPEGAPPQGGGPVGPPPQGSPQGEGLNQTAQGLGGMVDQSATGMGA